MIEHGADIESKIENGITDSDLAISHYHKKAAKDTSNHHRHSIDREPPFRICVGLLLLAKNEKALSN